MSLCRTCQQSVEISLKTGKPKLYCSKKCANKWHHKKNYIKKHPDWGTRGNKKKIQALQEQIKREKHNSWIDRHCISQNELAKQLNVHPSTINNRIKVLNLRKYYKIVVQKGQSKTYAWVSKQDFEVIKGYKKLDLGQLNDLGFINRVEASQILGVSPSYLSGKLLKVQKSTKKAPVERKYITFLAENKPKTACFYKKADILQYKAPVKIEKTCKSCGTLFVSESNQTICTPKCTYNTKYSKKQAEIKSQINKLGVISLKKASKIIGCSPPYAKKHSKTQKINGLVYISHKNVEILKKKYQKYQNKAKKDNIIRRNDNWQHWKSRETKLISKFPEKIAKWEAKYGNSRTTQVIMDSISLNLRYHQNMIQQNVVKKFVCGACDKEKAFYKFYFSDSSPKKGRYTQRCCKCTGKINKNKYNPHLQKENWRKNHVSRLRTLVATSVKRHIAKITGEYCDFSTSRVWNAIKDQCGYDIDDLVAHLEENFSPNMNWGNQKTPKLPEEYGWHLDHVESHSNYHYSSLQEAEFARCWDLNNLRPLEARVNMIKGNKKLYSSFQGSFRTGIRRGMTGKTYEKGIWQFLEYNNLAAAKYIEKKFTGLMNWKNWGTIWQLDHINPVAHLAFSCHTDENFQKCWSLENLQPLIRRNNSKKSSRWKNTFWIHNFSS